MRPIFRLLLSMIWFILAAIPVSWVVVSFTMMDMSEGIVSIILLGLPSFLLIYFGVHHFRRYIREKRELSNK